MGSNYAKSFSFLKLQGVTSILKVVFSGVRKWKTSDGARTFSWIVQPKLLCVFDQIKLEQTNHLCINILQA